MNNPSFEVYINNNLVSIAGIRSEFGVLTAIVRWVKTDNVEHNELGFELSGLDVSKDEYLTWLEKGLKISDEVTIKVVDSDNISVPTIRPKITEEELLERKISYFHRLKEELKDHI